MLAPVVRCVNSSCPHKGLDRRALAYPGAGDGLHYQPTIHCSGCGHVVKIVGSAADGPGRQAVASPPVKRGRRG